jgi:uncharacterized membrane protein
MKIIGTIVGLLIALLLVLVLIAPREFKMERDVIINKPKDQVFAHLKQLKNHDQWNAWLQKDPNAKRNFTGDDGTVGFVSSWESENKDVGTGEQIITGISEGQRLDTEIRFKVPFETNLNSYLITDTVVEDQAKVTMGMYQKMSIPLSVIHYICSTFMGSQKQIEADMDTSLRNLKAVLEKQ